MSFPTLEAIILNDRFLFGAIGFALGIILALLIFTSWVWAFILLIGTAAIGAITWYKRRTIREQANTIVVTRRRDVRLRASQGLAGISD